MSIGFYRSMRDQKTSQVNINKVYLTSGVRIFICTFIVKTSKTDSMNSSPKKDIANIFLYFQKYFVKKLPAVADVNDKRDEMIAKIAR